MTALVATFFLVGGTCGVIAGRMLLRWWRLPPWERGF